MFYKILLNKETKGKVFISGEISASHILPNQTSTPVSAGHRSLNTEVIPHPALKEDEFMISEDVLESLAIPADIKYQVRFVKNGIRFGPVIGLLMTGNKNSLTKRKLKGLSDYSLIYPEVNGLLLALSAEGIDFEKGLAEGYYYNSDADGKNTHWREGIFPLPDSIFQRANVPEDVMIKLKQYTGNRVFNSNYFSKWEFWKMMSKFDTIREHLPHTRLLSSVESIDYMLSNYDAVYLKPINGTLSRGLYKVKKDKNSYIFQGKKGTDVKRTSFGKETEEFIKNITGGYRYLIQQAIHPLMIDGRHIDFRVIMQKDDTLKWVCPVIVAFLGDPGDICSNWGYQTTFKELFSRHYNFSQEKVFKKRQEVIEVCRNVCEMLSLTGENYGDLGFDVVIDESLKVWVLESNKRHYHSVPLWINDVQSFYEVKANIVKYAAALSGFSVFR